jgi:hypothetical protein
MLRAERREVNGREVSCGLWVLEHFWSNFTERDCYSSGPPQDPSRSARDRVAEPNAKDAPARFHGKIRDKAVTLDPSDLMLQVLRKLRDVYAASFEINLPF